MLNKLVIKGYAATNKRRLLGIWTAQINPEGYRQAYRTILADDSGVDSAGTVIRYRTQQPQDLSLRFFLDGTGITPNDGDVAERVEAFRELAYAYNGIYHSPNALEVIWGQLIFKCMLQSLEIDYTLFAPDGRPLRAELTAAFRENKTPEEVARKASKRSADLTHQREIVAGDTLPLVANEVYHDPAYFIDVARANNLDDLTLIEPGDKIVFPRMEE